LDLFDDCFAEPAWDFLKNYCESCFCVIVQDLVRTLWYLYEAEFPPISPSSNDVPPALFSRFRDFPRKVDPE
uniref:MHD1 domain-containing protein n=1 Tax=Haemonchus placei TaxID=6290 RepID=A0A0N4VUY2_HAEPC